MDPRLETTALVELNCKLADLFDISITRGKCGGGRGKIQFLFLRLSILQDDFFKDCFFNLQFSQICA